MAQHYNLHLNNLKMINKLFWLQFNKINKACFLQYSITLKDFKIFKTIYYLQKILCKMNSFIIEKQYKKAYNKMLL